MRKSARRILVTGCFGLWAISVAPLLAGEADVVDAQARFDGETWSFSVTVAHGDTGWDHYADQWVVAHPESGEIYGVRELLHPHVEEQPFTRSLSAVTIPDNVSVVVLSARDSVHGFGGKVFRVELER